MHPIRFVPLTLATLTLAWAAHGAGEADLRAGFAKAYAAPDTATRKAALETLRGAQEKATWQMLYTVCTAEKESDLKRAAFAVLCDGKDPDGSRANIAALIFKAEKDRETRRALAEQMAGLEFRAEALAELCAFAAALRYPDLPDPSQLPNSAGQPAQGAQAGNNAGQTLKLIEQTRDLYAGVLKAINTLATGQLTEKLQPSRNSPQEVKAWWAAHAHEVQKADLDLRKQKAAEAAAAKAAGK